VYGSFPCPYTTPEEIAGDVEDGDEDGYVAVPRNE